MKMPKNLSTKYYQKNKERLQKKLVKDIKSNSMVVNVTKISQKMKINK